ncbi:OPT/YSL family transporter [Propionimicrobium sp. PCR01-08-3]|uniref:OPT/YSL family transporter n=1 Tax=Propionimicrobium sp. PCR01-08-3 TaxID=3052086 RepID=UPI00255CE7FF|nr:OPT/YSL family transporter [Propionimicrobium sp. PCR01-08-3]WIY83205.1 OPT/YSL family transporter [Propionimicrobium sp. PCR01-08-3]
MIFASAFGAIIGIQIITSLGVTPNTAIIGVLVAIAISRIPIQGLHKLRNVHAQNLIQSNISTSTFAAANSLLLPIGIPFILGRPELVFPMLIGAAAAMLIDFFMLYWMFDSKVFPASNPWPPGFAAAEAIKAGDKGGRRAMLLGAGTLVGIGGSAIGIPMSAFGVAFIGNMVALGSFGVGQLIGGYSTNLFGFKLGDRYIPHGMMIGAGVVALIQAVVIVVRARKQKPGATTEEEQLAETVVQAGDLTTEVAQAELAAEKATDTADADYGEGFIGEEHYTRDSSFVSKALTRGIILYIVAALALALISGIVTDMSGGQLVAWVLFASISCLMAEFIVGLSAMHSGWFPAFATSLIFLTIGMLAGFPPLAVGLLVGFVAAGGPAFADAGYDFKAGWLLRKGESAAFELAGRKQQFIAGLIGMGVALAVVALTYHSYFNQDLFPPVVRVYQSTIEAGLSDASIWKQLLIWAVPGAIIQAIGGANRQIGIMLATGLLLSNSLAGWTVLAGLLLRFVYGKIRGEQAESEMTIAAAGFIAGDALWGFGSNIVKASVK